MVVERLVRLLHGPERALDLALGARGRARAVRACRHVRGGIDVEALDHPLEHGRLRDRAVVEVEPLGDALERVGGPVRLRRHRPEQEPERRLHVLAIDAVVFEVGQPRTVVDYREQHQRGRATSLQVHPRRGHGKLLQVRRAHVEVPQVVRVLRLEADGRGFARHAGVIVAEPAHMPVQGRDGEQPGRELAVTVGRVDAVLLDQLERSRGREVPAFPVRGALLHCGDDLAPALDLGITGDTRVPAVGAVRVARTMIAAQRPVQGGARHGVEPARRSHHFLAVGMPGRQRSQLAFQGRERLGRNRCPACGHAACRSSRAWVGAFGVGLSSSIAWPGALGVPSPLT